MSVTLVGGVTGSKQEVDTTPLAARVLLYDAAGNVISRNKTFMGAAEVEVKQSATTGAGAVVWALHNPSSTKTIYVSRIDLRCLFDGTAAATLMKYEVIKATSVNTFSGGVIVTPVTKKTGQSAIGVVRMLDTGLTTTGIAAVQVLGNIYMGRVTQTTTNYQQASGLWYFDPQTVDEIQLAQNEILAIRQTVTSVIADNIVGTVEWYEA